MSPRAETPVGALAERQHADPFELVLDHMLDGGNGEGRGLIYVPLLNYAEHSLDAVWEMLQHDCVVPGLSDGGTHVGTICDRSFPTTNLVHWTRDRTRGPRLSLKRMVKAQCRDTAETVGLYDRGVVAPGYHGDPNVIDYDRLKLRAPEVIDDLPRGRVASCSARMAIRRQSSATRSLTGRAWRPGRCRGGWCGDPSPRPTGRPPPAIELNWTSLRTLRDDGQLDQSLLSERQGFPRPTRGAPPFTNRWRPRP
jgi:N-acyl-D-aspartate/D-glutamate deacylase